MNNVTPIIRQQNNQTGRKPRPKAQEANQG